MLTTIAALALVAAACGTSTTESAPVLAGGEGVAAMELAYTFGTGEQVSYLFDASIDMSVNMDGTGNAAGALPGPMVVGMDMTGIGDFAVEPGPDPGTKAITVNFDFSDLSIREFDMAGESMVDQLGADELAEMAGADGFFPEMTMVVDDHGNVLSVGVGDTTLPMDLLGGSSMGGGFGDIMGPTSFFGPSFPEGELAVGSTWSVDDLVEIPMFGELASNSDFSVTQATVKEGHTLFLIESTTRMGRLEVDLMDAFREMATADGDSLAAMGMTRQDLDMATQMMADFDMTMVMDAAPSTTLTWFDATAGLVTESATEVQMNMLMDMSVPGEGTMTMDMDMAATVSLKYLSRAATS
jgi:hypothetical protein